MRRIVSTHRVAPWFFGVVLAVATAGFSGCAGDGGDDDNGLNSKNDNNDNGDLGNDDSHDGNGQENFTDDDKGGDKGGADVNSAPDAGAEPAGGDTGLNGDQPGGAAPPPDPGANAGNNTPNPAPLNPAPPAAPNNAPPPPKGGAPVAGDTTPVPGGRVRYVKEGGAQAVNAPNGTPVMSIDQGEHPVTWEENGFLRIATGVYVPTDSMSDKGVPRPMGNRQWSH